MTDQHPTESANAGSAIPPTGKRGKRRRQRILDAFHERIIEKGYAKTTLRDVADAADMTASHLLYYFPGKDAILETYFENVARLIENRLEGFRDAPPRERLDLITDLFFAGKGITRSEIGFMLECFGVAVHDKVIRIEKKKLDRFCKQCLRELFEQSPCGPENAADSAEIAYAILIGLRTAAYFDKRVKLSKALRLFRTEILILAKFDEAIEHEGK